MGENGEGVSTERIRPNICPMCLSPLTLQGRCVMPDCASNMLCPHCKMRLNVFQQCVEQTCPRYDPTIRTSPISEEQDFFLEQTLVRTCCAACGEIAKRGAIRCGSCGKGESFASMPPPRSTVPPSLPPPRIEFSRKISGVIPRSGIKTPFEQIDLEWDEVLASPNVRKA